LKSLELENYVIQQVNHDCSSALRKRYRALISFLLCYKSYLVLKLSRVQLVATGESRFRTSFF